MRLSWRSACFLVFGFACTGNAFGQPALAPGQVLALRVEPIGPQQSRVQVTSPDGTKLSVETRDVAVMPNYELKDGKYYPASSVTVYFGPGNITSSLNPALTKTFPCLMVTLPTDRIELNGSIRNVAETMGRGRWDYFVMKSCLHRGRFDLP